MIKGHVCIDLHNHNSGFTERIEKNNMVTNALNSLIALSLHNPYSDKLLTPIATKGLGGLFLFDNNLEESPNNIMFPTTAHIVGHAGSDVTTSSKIKGSKNNVECKETYTTSGYSYTHVWDFNTSQANGKIKSLSLTSEYGGNSPFNFTEDLNWHSVNVRSFKNVSNNDPHIVLIKYDANSRVLYYGKLSFLRAEKNVIFEVYKTSLSLTELLLYTNCNSTDITCIDSTIVFSKTFKKTRYNEWTNNYTYHKNIVVTDKYIYVYVPANYWDCTIARCTINSVINGEDDFKVGDDLTTITDTDAPSLNINGMELYHFKYNDYYYQKEGTGYRADNNIAVIDPDGTGHIYTKDTKNTMPVPDLFNAMFSNYDEILVSNKFILYPDGTKVLMDTVSKPTETTRHLTKSLPFIVDDYGRSICNDFMYLGTICNLDETITKTESTSMKVTYTLSTT